MALRIVGFTSDVKVEVSTQGPKSKSNSQKEDTSWTVDQFVKDAAWFAKHCMLPASGELPHKINDVSEEMLEVVFGEKTPNGYKMSLCTDKGKVTPPSEFEPFLINVEDTSAAVKAASDILELSVHSAGPNVKTLVKPSQRSNSHEFLRLIAAQVEKMKRCSQKIADDCSKLEAVILKVAEDEQRHTTAETALTKEIARLELEIIDLEQKVQQEEDLVGEMTSDIELETNK
ncbi:unnamed protein product [Calypogeia fissa]